MYTHSKLYSVISYITWIGFLIALFARDKRDTLVKQHLNQAFSLNIISTIGNLMTNVDGAVATVGSAIGVAALVFSIWGIIRAFQMDETPLPVIGEFRIIK